MVATCMRRPHGRRYLSEHVPVLPLGVPGRLVATHDAPLGLVALLERPPWERWRASSAGPGPSPGAGAAAAPRARPRLERYEGGQWRAVPPADRLQLVQPAMQVAAPSRVSNGARSTVAVPCMCKLFIWVRACSLYMSVAPVKGRVGAPWIC
jgi:hypothetical protein